MAEGISKDMLKRYNKVGINVSSAGISVFPGEHANEKAIKALKEKGIDITGHRARQLSDVITKADIVLAMTFAHKAIIKDYFISNLENPPKVFTLKEFAAKISTEKLLSKDIDDPYGRDYNFYKKSRDEIERELNKIFKNIDKAEEI